MEQPSLYGHGGAVEQSSLYGGAAELIWWSSQAHMGLQSHFHFKPNRLGWGFDKMKKPQESESSNLPAK